MKFDSDRKQLFKYFRYFLTLLLIVTLSLAGLQYFYTDNLLQKDAAANSRNMFTLLRHSHDTLFKQLDKSISGLFNNAMFINFMDHYKANRVNRMIEAYDQLSKVMRSTDLIQCICLYYPNDGVTLSTNQSLSSLDMYHAKDFLLSLKQDDITGHKTYLRKVYYALANTPSDVVSVVRTLPVMVVSGPPSAYVIIDLKMSEISKAFEEVTIGNNASLMIFDERKNPISVIGRYYDIDSLLGEERVLTSNTVSDRVRIDGEELIVYSTASDIGWIYVYAQNMSEYNEKLIMMRNSSLLLLIGVLVMGLFYAWIASRKLYNPIKRISAQLGNPDVDIFDRIDDVVRRNEQLDQALQENVIIGRNQQLLQQTLMNFGAQPGEGGHLRLEAGEKVCALFLLGTDNDLDTLPQARVTELLKPFGMRPLIRLFSGQCEIACVIAAQDFSADNMRRAARSIIDILPEDTDISIGVSLPFDDAVMLPSAYHQALEALGMRLVRGNKSVCCACEIQNRTAPDYPYKIENAILRAFKTFEDNDVYKETKAFEEYLIKHDAAASTVRDFYTQLFCSFQRLLLELPVNTASAAAFNHRDMLKLTSIAEMSEYMLELFQTLMITRAKPGAKSELIDRVCAYIETHLADAPTVESLAGEFFMSVSGLRAEFQRARGISIKNYIDQVRVEVAKDMLKHTSKKIQDIAHKLGFNYAQSFIAFFKSATGMTPGEYRYQEQLRKLDAKSGEGADGGAN